ncbi:MAG TPA: hypothetical protein VGO57_09920 [Verrucomicrobiae bacterium]|jgi:hypothetical protein
MINSSLLRSTAITAILALASVARAAIPPAENLLPADTFVFFTVPDCDVLRATSKVSSQLMFWNDPAMKPFHDKFMDKLNTEYIAPVEKNLGIKVADFVDLLHGQATVGMTINGSNGHDDVPPGFVLLLDAKGKSDSLKTNLTALIKKWTDAGRAVRTETIRGLPFTVITLTTNELADIMPQRPPVQELGKDPKPDKPVDIYFTQYQSLLIVGNSPKNLEAVAAHLTGGSMPALADDALFAADKLSQFRDAPTYYGWFNAKSFFNLISQSLDNSDDTSPFAPNYQIGKILDVTGLSGLKSASFAIRQAREGSLMTMHLNAPDSSRTGILKILALAPKDANAPAFVPADAIKFSRIRLDGKQTWAELQKIVAAISPNGLAQVNSVIDIANSAAQQKDPSFDLRNTLIGNLGDDIINYQKSPVGDSVSAFASPPALTLVAVSNPDQVIQSVKVIASMVASQSSAPEPRDFRGHKIYSIALNPQRAADGSAIPAKPLLLTSSGGYVAFGTDPGVMEEYLRSADGKTKPLSQIAGLTDAAQQIGGTGGGMFGYENQREAMRIAFKLLKNAGTDSTMQMFPPMFRDWLDFSLLPDFTQISKYFYMSVYGGSANTDGINLKVFTPRPPQMN